MCRECEKNPVYEFTNQRKLCAKCFVRYFQKKVLYTIRKFGMVQNGDVINYFGTQGRTLKNIQKNIFTKGKNFRSVVLEDVLKMFAEKARVELKKIVAYSRSQINQTNNKEKIAKFAIGQTLDDTSYEIVEQIINGKIKELNVKPVEGKIIKPLYLFLDKEVLLYAKLRKLRYKKSSHPPTREVQLINFINELEIKHPEIKNAIVKGWLKIEN